MRSARGGAPPSRGATRLAATLDAVSVDRVSGAHRLARTTSRALGRAIRIWNRDPPPKVRAAVRSASGHLDATQPAMGVFHRWAVEWSDIARNSSDRDLLTDLARWQRTWADRLRREPGRLARVARRELPPAARVLTLSRSDSVRRALLAPRRARRPRAVVVLESRPGGEGRTFARELLRAGLPARAVTDAEGRQRVRDAGLVLIGADAVYADGSVVHKVGTRRVALAAKRAGVPVVVVAGRSKIVPGAIPTARLPRLFDRTPAMAVHEYWTDLGRIPAARWSRFTARAR